jgi:hypothetical protein
VVKKKINFNFVKFLTVTKARQIIFPPFLVVAGSEMVKKSRSGLKNPDPQHFKSIYFKRISKNRTYQLLPTLIKFVVNRKKIAEPDLVADGGNETVELGVAGELSDMLDEPLDHLGVPLPEGRHQAGHLPVVLAVDVRT